MSESLARWLRSIGIAVLGLSLACILLVGFVLAGLVKINAAVDGQDAALERARCVTETYAPFWSHLARALVELNDDGTISDASAEALRADADLLETVNERCSG